MSGYDVVVTVGTDHHRFDRLTDWLQPWVSANPQVRVLHQHGTSRPLQGAETVALVPRATLVEAVQGAAVVVAQAGPGTVSDARACGHVPLVVPRSAALREVVDDHQVAFAQHVEALGWVRVVSGPEQLHRLVGAALDGTAPLRTEPRATDVSATAEALHAAVVRAVTQPRPLQPARVRQAARLLVRRSATRPAAPVGR